MSRHDTALRGGSGHAQHAEARGRDFSVSIDQPSLTVLRSPTLMGVIIMQVGSYAGEASGSLTKAISEGPRLQIVDRKPSSVAGAPATRFVVAPVAGAKSGEWFCPAAGDHPCMVLDPTGGSTMYVFQRRGQDYVIVGGSINQKSAERVRPVVDGIAATWQWRGAK